MRSVLIIACTCLPFGAIACGSDTPSEAEPATVRVAGAPTDTWFAVAQEALARYGVNAVPAYDDEADLVITSSNQGGDGAHVVATRYWVAAVQLASPARDISMAELGDAVAGRSATWRRLLVPDDVTVPIWQWWGGMTPVEEAVAPEGIPLLLAADPSAIAILPLENVDARFRALTIDGVNIVFGAGDGRAYGLTEFKAVMARPVGSKAVDEALAAAASDVAAKLAVAPPEPIVLRATGDIIPSRCAYAKQRGYGDYRHAFLELGPWLSEADITVGSLDASIADISPPFGCTDTFNLAAPAASVEGLTYAGYDVITVATNHVKDCGQIGACGDEAFFATLDNLRSHGIQTVGGGIDLADARRPAMLTVNGVRFAFLGYDEVLPLYHAAPGVAGTAPLEEAYVREDVAAALQQADVAIVLPQWGVEYTTEPTARQRSLAAAAFEAGATMVIGNHPHWVQAVQALPGRFVTYALGNFVFDQDWSLETQQGAVLEAAFHGSQLKGIEIYPIHIYDEHQPAFAGPEEARQILERIWDASARLR